MRCKRGISVQGTLKPCGQCLNCRINRQREWTARIIMEWVTHPGMAYFVTLTYNDDHVPRTPDDVPTLQKRSVQKFLQNAYRDLGPFRYYIVGEYGDDTLRPHYHLALFPRSDSQAAGFTKRWDRGFTSAYPLTEKRAAYCARYTTKKLTSNTDERLAPNQEPEFRLSSQRPPLGTAFVSSLVRAFSTPAGRKFIEENGDIERAFRMGGSLYPIPRYVLGKARRELGIPQKHEDRLAHPGYYETWSEREFASWEPKIAVIEEMKWDAKTKANKLRKTTLNL